MKRVLLRACGVALGALAIFLVGGELALRATGFSAPIWYQPDAQLGWRMRPGARGWFTREGRAYAEVSEAGFRDRAHALAKAAGAYRIAVLGDSAVEALQVGMESTFWRRLEENLRRCPALGGREPEVLAFGVSGYGTAQQYLLLESTALRYAPDLVLLAFAPNDLRNNSARLEPENERPFFVPDGDGLRLDASFARRPAFASRVSPAYQAYRSASDRLRIVQLVQAARHGFDIWRQVGAVHASPGPAGIEPTTVVALFAPPRDSDWMEAWTVTERLIARMHQTAARNQARFALAVITHSAQVHPDAAMRGRLQDALGVQDLFYIERRLQGLGGREGYPVFALAPELQRLADQAVKTYFHGFENYRLGWGHWNAEGHRVAAAILAPRLCAAL